MDFSGFKQCWKLLDFSVKHYISLNNIFSETLLCSLKLIFLVLFFLNAICKCIYYFVIITT